MLVFHKQDAEFRSWVGDHPDGLVINAKSRTQQMMHRVHCDHFSFADISKEFSTRTLKVCADGFDASSSLQLWNFRTYKIKVLLCETCEP